MSSPAMIKFQSAIIDNAGYDYDYDSDAESITEDIVDEWIQHNYNRIPNHVPDDFSLDWIEVINVIHQLAEESGIDDPIEYPINKQKLYNQLIYFTIQDNQNHIYDEIKRNEPDHHSDSDSDSD
jgi:hypothetical protein